MVYFKVSLPEVSGLESNDRATQRQRKDYVSHDAAVCLIFVLEPSSICYPQWSDYSAEKIE